jgi:hypothetical protein
MHVHTQHSRLQKRLMQAMSTREGTATASGVQDDLALLRMLCTSGIIRAKRAKPAATATADTEVVYGIHSIMHKLF